MDRKGDSARERVGLVKVLVAGGGVAALEGLLALRDLVSAPLS